MRILLVEDDPDVRTLMAAWLSDAGHDVVEAIDYTAAESRLTAFKCCDAVISAAVLPGGSGLDLARHAQQVGLPILLCTGDLSMMMWLEARGIPHLRKPFYLQALTAWLTETFAGEPSPVPTRH